MNESAGSAWRRVGRQLWIRETPAGRLGIIRNGFWYIAIDSDGSTAGRRTTCARAQLLLTRRPAVLRPEEVLR